MIVSSATIALAGVPARISAIARAIEVGVRAQAFSTRAFCAAASCFFISASAALRLPRPRAKPSSADCRQRHVERRQARARLGHHAGIEGEIVGQARRRLLDLQQLGASRERRAGCVPDFLEERTAHHQHQVVAGEALGDARRIEA